MIPLFLGKDYYFRPFLFSHPMTRSAPPRPLAGHARPSKLQAPVMSTDVKAVDRWQNDAVHGCSEKCDTIMRNNAKQ